jgi:hypothetical protein
MLKAVRDIPSEEVRAEVTRVSEDHELASRFPDAFEPATDGPPMGTALGRAYFGQRLVTDPDPADLLRELATRKRRLAELDAKDRARETRKYEPEEERRVREFWEGTQRFLASLGGPEAEDDPIHDLSDLDRAKAEAKLQAVDDLWNPN